ncbi:MAG: hypothetical protein ACAH20_11770 [Methylobacteriaceae bacterium]|jgi:hypothetical protein|nr:hypothetical protein ASF36_12655 [Methylobacterium sp. Leaf90]
MTKRMCLAGAALLAVPLMAPLAVSAQVAAPGGGNAMRQDQPAPALPKGACRVTDRLGGRSCTGDVPESACAAIAKEAKGEYAWTQDECP